MAHLNESAGQPFKAASAIAQWVPVIGLEGSSSIDETVIRAGSYNQFPIGMSIASAASPGDPITVVTEGRVKAIAAASLGAFTPVGVGSTNGHLIPLARGAGGQVGPSAHVATVLQINQVGIAMTAAADGDVFTILVDPLQIV